MQQKIKKAFGSKREQRAWKRLFKKAERYYRKHPERLKIEMKTFTPTTEEKKNGNFSSKN